MQKSLGRVTWQKIHTVLDQALELPKEDRIAFIDQACGDDAVARGEILSLLEMEAVPTAELDFRSSAHEAFKEGRLIGPYRLEKLLGYGGFGQAWLAHQETRPKDQVVVKLMSPEVISENNLRRFQREQRVLAQLNHPNIARFIDAGHTQDGIPYLVMDYVLGQPLDVYCSRRKLSLSERLDLCCRVFEPVDFAHREGIVHRDLKPSNILVTPEGKPILLDFGIARDALEEHQTRTGGLAMTPAYAAPEQARGEPSGIAADIYSLGALVTKLITDQLPLDLKDLNLAELIDTLSNKIPPPLSSRLNVPDQYQSIFKDLDQVIARALNKDPYSRQESAAQLGRQLKRLSQELETLVVSRPKGSLICAALEDKETITELSLRDPETEAAKLLFIEDRFGQKEVIKTQLSEANRCLVIASGGKHQPWSNLFFSKMLDERVERGDLNVITAVFDLEHRPDQETLLPRVLRNRFWVQIDPENESCFANLLIDGEDTLTQGDRQGVCPYQGLAVFGEKDSHFFFGREALIQRLLNHLSTVPILVVLGPSGSGKSSAVQAGLLPIFRNKGHQISLLTPGPRPLHELAYALLEEAEGLVDLELVVDQMRSSKTALHQILNKQTGQQPFMLVIDQFEELFTLVEDQNEADQFVANLLYAFEQQERPFFLILTMRSDFVGRCSRYEDLNYYVSERMVQVGSMNRTELQQTILAPARLAGLQFEEGLIERILDDVQGTAAELPLLEHALLELYNKRRGFILTNKAYQTIGGIEGSLARRAEQEFTKLDLEEQKTIRKFFTLCLVHPGEGAEDTRRRADKNELLAVGNNDATTEKLIDQWVQARLLTIHLDKSRERVTIDIAHEAIIRRWDRISMWMNEDRETARVFNTFRQLAGAWLAADCDEDHLPVGGQLARFIELGDKQIKHFNQVENDFLTAAVQAKHLRDHQAEEQLKKDLKQSKTLAFRARLITGLATIMLIIIAAFLWITNEKEKQVSYDLAMELIDKSHLTLERGRHAESLRYTQQALEILPKKHDATSIMWHQDMISNRTPPIHKLMLRGSIRSISLNNQYDMVFVSDHNELFMGLSFPDLKTIWKHNFQGKFVAEHAFSPDKKLLALLFINSLMIVEPETGEILSNTPFNDIAFWLSFINNNTVVVCDQRGNTIFINAPNGGIKNIVNKGNKPIRYFSNRENGVFYSHSETISVFDANSEALIATHNYNAGRLRWESLPNGNALIREGNKFSIIDPQKGIVYSESTPVNKTLNLPNGKTIFSSDQSIFIMNSDRPKEKSEVLKGISISQLFFNSMNKSIWTLGKDNTIRIIDFEGKIIRSMPNPSPHPVGIIDRRITRDSFDPNRGIIVMYGKNYFQIYDLHNETYLSDPIFHPDQNIEGWLVGRNRKHALVLTRRTMYNINLSKSMNSDNFKITMPNRPWKLISDKKNRIASIHHNKAISFYNPYSGKRINDHLYPRKATSFSSNNNVLGVFSEDSNLSIFNWSNGSIVKSVSLPKHIKSITGISNEHILFRGSDALFKARLTEPRKITAYLPVPNGSITSTSPDGKLDIVLTQNPNRLHIYSHKTEKEILKKDLNFPPNIIKWSTNSKHFMLIKQPRNLEVWSVDPMQKHNSPHESLDFFKAVFISKGHYFLLSDAGRSSLHNTKTMEEKLENNVLVHGAHITENEKLIIYTDNTNEKHQIYDTQNQIQIGPARQWIHFFSDSNNDIITEEWSASNKGNELIIAHHGWDKDLPSELRKLRSEYLTTRFNGAKRGPNSESIVFSSHEIAERYEAAAAAHAEVCQYPRYNYYLNMYLPLHPTRDSTVPR